MHAPTAFLAAALLLPAAAFAQQAPQAQPVPPPPSGQAQQQGGPPPRVANQWNGQAHVMPPGQQLQDEQAAGVALNPAQQKRQTDEVETLEKQILQGTQQGPGAGANQGPQ